MIQKSLKATNFLESYRTLQWTCRKHAFLNHLALTILADGENWWKIYPSLSFESLKNLKQDVFSLQLSKIEKAATEALPYHTLETKVEKKKRTTSWGLAEPSSALTETKTG